MQCSWTIDYSPETVTIDTERGSEPGARFRLRSDWGDDFIVFASRTDAAPEGTWYTQINQWTRAEDGGVVPFYFWDCLPDLTSSAVSSQQPGTGFIYLVDLAERTGNQTARELWVSENG